MLVTVSQALTAVCGAFVLCRLLSKFFISKIFLMLDDWLILVTLCFGTTSVCVIIYGAVANGLGRDIWTLAPDNITAVLKYFYAMTILYFIETTLVKLSIISFYIRIFPSRETRRVLWATFAITTLWGVAFAITAAFQCWPIRFFWLKWDGQHQGKCINTNALAWANACINIALDLWVLAVPMWELRRLQLHWKKKVGVGLMFFLGTL